MFRPIRRAMGFGSMITLGILSLAAMELEVLSRNLHQTFESTCSVCEFRLGSVRMKERDPHRDLLTERVGRRIRQYREARELTQTDLAKAIREDQSLVSKWERGKAYPRPRSLMGLARALEVKVSDFFVPLPDEREPNGDHPEVAA
jgi:ribosome-binding protein aMBF1 (putative translation factor)